MAQKKFYDELERLKQRLAARETYRTAVPTAGLPAALEPYLRKPYGPRPGPPATLGSALTYPTNNMVRPDDRAEFAARETYRTMIPPPAPPPPLELYLREPYGRRPGPPAPLETYLTQPYGPPAAAPAAPYFRASDLKIPAQPNANTYSGNAINRIINRAANVGAPSPLGGTAWDAIKAQMNAPKAKAPTRSTPTIPAARPMTVRGANQWANVDPEAGMDQMFAPAIAAANAAMSDPEAGMDQMYAAEIAQSLKKPTARRVAAKGPTKAQQKIIDDAAKNYQSNSMPVLIQPQGPMKGGATMQPSINWGDANDAADFFRADELRRKMPGLLGWGGE